MSREIWVVHIWNLKTNINPSQANSTLRRSQRGVVSEIKIIHDLYHIIIIYYNLIPSNDYQFQVINIQSTACQFSNSAPGITRSVIQHRLSMRRRGFHLHFNEYWWALCKWAGGKACKVIDGRSVWYHE